jgi:hypothetical protein
VNASISVKLYAVAGALLAFAGVSSLVAVLKLGSVNQSAVRIDKTP